MISFLQDMANDVDLDGLFVTGSSSVKLEMLQFMSFLYIFCIFRKYTSVKDWTYSMSDISTGH